MAVGVALPDYSGRDSAEYVDYACAVFLRRSLLVREGGEHGVCDDFSFAEANDPQHVAVRDPRRESEDCNFVADTRNSVAELGEAFGEGAEGFAVALAYPE